MAPRLTDYQKKRIIASYVETGTYRTAARACQVSVNTVRKLVQADTEMLKKAEQKKAENAADVLAYMADKKETVCEIIGNALDALNDVEKLRRAPPTQIATTIGILIDKWSAISKGSDGPQSADALSQSLAELAEALESD